MGPRQDAGEDLLLGLKYTDNCLSLQWGPGRMPGKTVLRTFDPEYVQQLQWGPGRMPGKTNR